MNILTLILCYMLVNGVYGVCGRPFVYTDIHTFGPDCRYRCNCLNNVQCNVSTGECPNGCLPGWMGPACQYRNLAAAANLARSEQYPPGTEFPPSYATDGNISTCSMTGFGSGQRYLTIDLGSRVYFVGLIIRIEASHINNFRGLRIEVSNNTSDFRLCYAHDRTDYINVVTEINCFQPMVGQHIRIKLSEEVTGALAVCEIGIYGGRIVSFNQNTSMDSVYSSTNTFYGAYAVDGKAHYSGLEINAIGTLTCASTDVDYQNPRSRWWRVDLLHSYSIQAVSFFARQDGNHFLYMYAGYYITVSVDGSTFIDIARDTQSNSQTDYAPKSHNLTWPREGRVLDVRKDKAMLFTLCELEVFADCPYGLCGWDCNMTCMCKTQTTGSHKILGTCPDGCAGRWTGINGKCNIECSDLKWGTACNQECGNCEGICNVVNGTCPGHCLSGWQPPFCTKGCEAGKYGTDCLMDCGNCLESSMCDRFNGQCSSGCKPGYKEPYCNDACDAGRYGMSCLLTCGRCRDKSICHHINGSCPNICDPGFERPTCKEVCRYMSFGLECKNECGKCKDGVTCNNVNGHCPEGCAPGWERTPFCNKFCDIGKFGAQCSERCGHCLNEETCHHENGICFNGCAAGYMGKDCRTVCVAGRYGEGCQHTCGSCAGNEPCNKTTGACPFGCSDQFRGILCKEEMSCPSTTGFIIGIVVCVVADVVMIVGIGIFIYKRRNATAKPQSMYTVPSVRTTRSDNDTYDVILSASCDTTTQVDYANASP